MIRTHRTGRVVAVVAAVGAAAGLALTGGTPASAAAATVTLQRPPALALAPAGVVGTVKTVQPNLSYRVSASGLTADITFTVDVRRLARIARVTFPDSCTVTDHVATCDDYLDQSDPKLLYDADVDMTVQARPGVALGSTARYTVTGTSDGATVVGTSGTVQIGGPAYQQAATRNLSDVAVGSTVSEPIRFTNIGDRPAAATQVALVTSPGLAFARTYANCAYASGRPDEAQIALCTFPGTFLPGERAALATPVRLRVEPTALATYLDSTVGPAGGYDVRVLAGHHTWTQGTGPDLGLTVLDPGQPTDAPAGTGTLAESGSRSDYRIGAIGADNTADFAVTGATAQAAQGATTTMRLTMVNHGPAAVFDRSGAPYTALVTPPPGSTVVAASDNCTATGSGTYYCGTRIVVPAGQVAHFWVTLRVDQVIPGARGSIAMDWSPDGSWRPPYDPDPTDDSAPLVLN
jgi:hypothetical protein